MAEFEEWDDAIIEAVFADIQENEDAADTHDNTESASTSTSGDTQQPSTSGNTRQPKKKKIPRPKSMFTLDNAIADQCDIIKEAVRNVATDEFVCEPTFQKALPVKAFADKCHHQIEQGLTETMMVQLSMTIQELWPAISSADKFSTGPARAESCLSRFFKLRSTSSSLMEKAKTMLRSLSGSSDLPIIFLQMFVRHLFDILMLRHEKILQKEAAPAVASILGREEKNALRYAAGYIVHRLPRKINNKKEKDGMLIVIDNMKVGSNKETRLSYTKEWVETQSRGGLTIVNDSTFLFFEKLESVIRREMPTATKQLKDTDLVTPITKAILEEGIVLDKWTSLCAHAELSEHASLIMLQILVGFYVQIRLFSFSKNIVERYKIHEKKQKQSRSLRGSMKRTVSAQDQTQ